MYILLMELCTFKSNYWRGVDVHVTNGVVYMYN